MKAGFQSRAARLAADAIALRDDIREARGESEGPRKTKLRRGGVMLDEACKWLSDAVAELQS